MTENSFTDCGTSRTRVGVVTGYLSPLGGGVFEVVRTQVAAIESLCDVRVFGLRDPGMPREPYSSASWVAIDVKVLPRFGYAPGLRKALYEYDGDLLHCHGAWMYPSITCRSWARRWNRPYITTVHGTLDDWALARSRMKKRVAMWAYADAHIRDAACIHALTEQELTCIRRLGYRNPVALVPNGIDILPGRPKRSRRWAEQFGCTGKALLFLGRIHPKKGLLPLLEGFKLALDRKADSQHEWSLVIAGWDDGGHEQGLREYVRDNALEKSVFFAGPLYGIAKEEAYESSDWFVLPSYSEGLPMTILEAWAHGLPVAMSSQCNLQAAYAQEAAIEMTPSPHGVETALQKIFAMPETQSQLLGQSGRLFAEKHFSMQRVARELVGVYDWVIGKTKMPACVRL